MKRLWTIARGSGITEDALRGLLAAHHPDGVESSRAVLVSAYEAVCAEVEAWQPDEEIQPSGKFQPVPSRGGSVSREDVELIEDAEFEVLPAGPISPEQEEAIRLACNHLVALDRDSLEPDDYCEQALGRLVKVGELAEDEAQTVLTHLRGLVDQKLGRKG